VEVVVEKVEEDSAVAVDEGEIEGEHDGSASSFCFFNLVNSTAALVAWLMPLVCFLFLLTLSILGSCFFFPTLLAMVELLVDDDEEDEDEDNEEGGWLTNVAPAFIFW